MGKIIGIDLGSTASCVAVSEGGKPTVIVNADGARTTPSIVSYSDNGEVRVGAAAKRIAVTNPKNTVSLVKRFMGNKYSDVERFKDKFSFEFTDAGTVVKIKAGGKELVPQEVSAEVLRKLKEAAEAYLGEKVTEAVITVPAYFNDAQRTATKEAGEIAGLEVKRIINEPTAAALAFGLDKLNKSMKVVVVDFGGSTADISALDMSDGVFEVISTKGDMFLGGNDVDNAVADWIVSETKTQLGADISKDDMAMQRVREAAEQSKIELSNTTSTTINLPYLTVVDNQPKHLTLTLSRAKFETLAEPFVTKVIDLAKDCLKDGKLTMNDIDEILLVGGSTRIPLVQETIKKVFGKEPNKSVNPDEAVALGAAIQGSVLAGEQTGILLLDVTPLNLNITTMGTVATSMIDANTTIPVTKTKTFTTAVDNQPAVSIEVTQGNRTLAKDNKQIGVFNLEGIAPAPKGIPQIEVSFSLDSNGILSVSATDKATGKSQSIRIEGSSGLSDEEIQKMRADAEANADADKKVAERIQKINEAESVIYSTEKQVKDLDEKLTDDEKKKINEALDGLKAVYNVKDEDRDLDAIEAAMKSLTEVWYPITTRMYQGDASTGGAAQFGDAFGAGGFDPSKFAPQN